MPKKIISLIVPVFNEDPSVVYAFVKEIENLIASLSHFDFELIFIDDSQIESCRQLTKLLAKEKKFIKTVHLSRRFGKERALRAGLEFSTGAAVIPIDVDLQDPIRLIPDMLDQWEKGFLVVLARRRDRSQENFTKRFWSSLFYKVLSKIGNTEIPSNVGDFRLLDKKVVKAILQLPEKNIFMKGIFSWVGFSTITLDFTRPNRSFGKSRFSFRKLLENGLDGIISFSSFPLRIWSYLGVFLGTLTIIYSFVMVYFKLSGKTVDTGYTSIIVVSLLSISMNMFCFGIFGEYLSRLFEEVKNRPHFIVENTYGFKDF